jgi:uncharacterized protein (DUF1778 family)
MTSHLPRKKNKRDQVISVDVSRMQKTLIHRAAKITGRNVADFILESACLEAREILLDQRHFVLSESDYKRFLERLEVPAKCNSKLIRLLKIKPPWGA